MNISNTRERAGTSTNPPPDNPKLHLNLLRCGKFLLRSAELENYCHLGLTVRDFMSDTFNKFSAENVLTFRTVLLLIDLISNYFSSESLSLNAIQLLSHRIVDSIHRINSKKSFTFLRLMF